MYPEINSTVHRVADAFTSQSFGNAAQRRVGATDRIEQAIASARGTLEVLSSNYDRLFGPMPARPDPAVGIGGVELGQPSLDSSITTLRDVLDRLAHATNCMADRI